MAETKIVTSYSVTDGYEVYADEVLLASGYDTPWPDKDWEPNEAFTVNIGVQAEDGYIISLRRRVCEWKVSSIPGVKPVVRVIEESTLVRAWKRTTHSWSLYCSK